MADSTPVTRTVTTAVTTAGTATGSSTLEKMVEQRRALRLRHSRQLTALMGAREDLRGVHALADFVDDAVRWCA